MPDAAKGSGAGTPARDRIVAITIAVLVHVLVLIPLLRSQGGGRAGHGPRQEAAGEGQETWIAADFMARPGKAAPKPIAAARSPVPVEDTPAAKPMAIADAAVASDATPQMAASPAQARQGGGDGAPQDDLDARYLAAVRTAILGKWNELGGSAIPAGCKVAIDQVDGGKALRAWVMECSALPMHERIRLETAVMQVQPLPYAGFEPVFQPHLELQF